MRGWELELFLKIREGSKIPKCLITTSTQVGYQGTFYMASEKSINSTEWPSFWFLEITILMNRAQILE